jgi:hypothetical protein
MPNVVTPGWFDFRPMWDRMPWPDVKGKRCLDVWTFDESLRFEVAGYRVNNLAGDAAKSRRFLRWNLAPRTWRYVPTARSSPLRPQRVRRSSSSSSI